MLRKYSIIIIQVLILFVFYFIGTEISTYLHLPVSGSIVGLVLLFIALVSGIFPKHWIDKGSNTLLSCLSFLFVPATVGVMDHLNLFTGNGLLLCLIAACSTLFTIAVGGTFTHILVKRNQKN